MWIPSWWPKLSFQVWLIFIGRLLSQTGTGFTLFYASLFFVNQVGLTATQVGLGLGIMAFAGVFGRILGGSMADGAWGRRSTLILSLAISTLGSFGFALSYDFWSFAQKRWLSTNGQPNSNSQMTLKISSSGLLASGYSTTSFPKGASTANPSLMLCQPKGMPMIVS